MILSSEKFLDSDNPSLLEYLSKFNDENAGIFNFPEVQSPQQIRQLWMNLFSCLTSPGFESNRQLILSCIRILSRDKKLLEDGFMGDDHVKSLFDCAFLSDRKYTSPSANFQVIIESMKCFCNILINSSSALATFHELKGFDCVLQRIADYKKIGSYKELALLDLRIIFLISALNLEHRKTFFLELNGVHLLSNFLLEFLEVDEGSSKILTSLEETELLTCSEVFKIQFNLLACSSEHVVSSSFKALLNSDLERIMIIMREFLLIPAKPASKLYKIQLDIINLLTVYPPEHFVLLMGEIDRKASDIDTKDPNMQPSRTIINILDYTLTEAEEKRGPLNELLSPLLMALLNLSQSHRLFRKYFRKIVLPHLKDVFKRPEEGNTIRNKLCRLLTSPVTSVSDLAANWLFVLCKEKASRMVKYTGYGNSAGLFARRGFSSQNSQYSSDSENSDTEEYLKNKEQINPVVGCRMVPQPNPLKDMTDEQKELLAMQLVNTIDKLQRGKIIQPCRIDEDGKPQPIEHVTQLQSELPDEEIAKLMEDD